MWTTWELKEMLKDTTEKNRLIWILSEIQRRKMANKLQNEILKNGGNI